MNKRSKHKRTNNFKVNTLHMTVFQAFKTTTKTKILNKTAVGISSNYCLHAVVQCNVW